MAAQFDIWKDGQYFWTFQGNNNEPICTSATYRAKRSAHNSIALVKGIRSRSTDKRFSASAATTTSKSLTEGGAQLGVTGQPTSVHRTRG